MEDELTLLVLPAPHMAARSGTQVGSCSTGVVPQKNSGYWLAVLSAASVMPPATAGKFLVSGTRQNFREAPQTLIASHSLAASNAATRPASP